MTINQAIKQADALRPNAVGFALKLNWVQELDIQFAEMMGIDYDPHTMKNADGTSELLMKAPHDHAYVLYLMARIDNAVEDVQSYQNDAAMANQAILEAKAWYRRNNNPNKKQKWKGVV